MGTGTISHIVSSRNLSASFTSAATHLITTAAHLKIVSPDQNDKGGGIHRGLYGKTLITMGGTPDILRIWPRDKLTARNGDPCPSRTEMPSSNTGEKIT